MSTVKLVITLRANSSYVTPSALEDHITDIAKFIESYAKGQQYEDYNRKIYVSYDEQEDVNLVIETKLTSEK